jgi:hypothetical protein
MYLNLVPHTIRLVMPDGRVNNIKKSKYEARLNHSSVLTGHTADGVPLNNVVTDPTFTIVNTKNGKEMTLDNAPEAKYYIVSGQTKELPQFRNDPRIIAPNTSGDVIRKPNGKIHAITGWIVKKSIKGDDNE